MNKQKGSIVIYATFLMLMLSSIVMLMAFIVLINLRSTRISTDAVVAYYAAETGLEKSLYTMKTDRDSQTKKLSQTLTTIDSYIGVDLDESSSAYTAVSYQETTNIYNIIAAGQNRDFHIYDTDTGNPLIVNPGTAIGIQWEREDQTCNPAYIIGSGNPADLEFAYESFTISTLDAASGYDETMILDCAPGSEPCSYNWSPTENFNYKIKTKPLYCDLEIEMLVNENGTLLPFPNYVNIESTGEHGDSSLLLNAQTLWQPPLSGLGEYVLFSEDILTK